MECLIESVNGGFPLLVSKPNVVPLTNNTLLMRKLYSFLAFFILCSTSYSQILFSEDFDGIGGPTAGGAGTYSFPSGWRLRNVDNSTPAAAVAYVNEAWERREDFAFNVADSAMFSTSWYSPIGTADDWAWTPAIVLTGNCQLKWNAVTYDISFPDGYEVRIMTESSTPGGPTGGTGTIGNQLTNSTQIFSIAAENSTWTARTIDLSAYNGQTVYIGFRNNSNDKFLLLIDDVIVEQVVNHNAQVSEPAIYEYTKAPITIGPEYALSAKVTSTGGQTITGVKLTADIYDASNNLVFTETSSPTSINSLANQVITFSDFVPSAAGNYTLYYHSSITETDEDAGDDSLMVSITVSDSVYSRDDYTATGALGIGAGNGGYLGQQFQINTADTLTSITMHMTRGYVGNPLAAVVWNMSGGFPSTIIGVTDTILYPDDSARVYTLPMLNLTVLDPGEYVITTIEFDSTVQLGLANTIFTNNKTWVNWPTSPFGNWANNEDFGASFAKSYMIRGNFGNVCYNIYDTTDVTLCYGEQLTVGSNTYTTSGTYTDMFPHGYCDSVVVTNLVILNEITSTIDTTICFGESYSVGASTYTTSGSYTDVLTNGTCDSTVYTNLIVLDQIDPQLSLSADLTTFICDPIVGASYQWIDCDLNMPISGATSNTYNAGATVMTASVVVTVGNCSNTSNCITNDGSGIDENSLANFEVHPNPATDVIKVSSRDASDFVLLNEMGQVLRTFTVEAGVESPVNVAKLARGIYFVKNTSTQETIKIVLR